MISARLIPIALIAALMTFIPNAVVPTMLSKAQADPIGIKWDGNGGTVNTAGASLITDFDGEFYADQGTQLVFPEDPTREGYSFIAWFSQPVVDEKNCSIGPEGACNNFVMQDGKLVFYARWEPETHQVMWDLQGGSVEGIDGNRIDTSYKTGELLQDIPADPERPGYVFAGWKPTNDPFRHVVNNVHTDSPLNYFNSDSSKAYPDITLYARWNVPITYESQGGSAIFDGEPTAHETVVFPGTPTREGYTFNGWFDAPTGGSAKVFPFESFRQAPYTLYAQWGSAITWNDQGATTASSGGPTTYTHGSPIGATPTTPPLRTGYNFAGWYTLANGAGNTVNAAYTPTDPFGEITFYAKWNPKSIVISFNSQGGSPIASRNNTSGGTIQAALLTPTRDGYTFNGWFESATGGSAISIPYAHGRIANFTLYAHWTANQNNKSTDATLSGLSLYGGPLSPTFASDTSNYTATVTKATDSTTVTSTVNQTSATIKVNGISVTSGLASSLIPLNIGLDNVIQIVVTAEDGTTTKAYTVTVTRQTDDATLSALTLSSGTLSPTFASATRSYAASVSDSSITVTPTLNQANATTVQYLGADGTVPFTGALSLGSNIIRTVVTALNGTTTKTYTVTVTRVDAPTYSITWDNQGADVRVSSGGSSSFTTGSAVATIPTTPPQKTGYTFAGWFTSAASGSQVTNGSYIPASPYGNLTLYAKWAVDEVSVKAAAAAAAAVAKREAAQAAAEAAAKREAEKQATRTEITNKLKSAKDLTVDAFAKAEIPGITVANIAEVQAELMALPEALRSDLNEVIKVAHKYEVIGNIASDQVKSMLPTALVEIGLIPATSKNKVALLAVVQKLPAASRDTYAEIKAAIDAATKEIQVRSDRLAAIIARNAARYKK